MKELLDRVEAQALEISSLKQRAQYLEMRLETALHALELARAAQETTVAKGWRPGVRWNFPPVEDE